MKAVMLSMSLRLAGTFSHRCASVLVNVHSLYVQVLL